MLAPPQARRSGPGVAANQGRSSTRTAMLPLLGKSSAISARQRFFVCFERVRSKARRRTFAQVRFDPIAINTLTSRVGSLGRVEDGRGSLGPMANAPFPI